MSDGNNILNQFKALGLVPEDSDRLEIVSRKVGSDQARYYLRGKCYPIAGLNVSIRPCDDPAIVELAKKRRNDIAASADTDNDSP